MVKLVTYRCILIVAALVLLGGCGRHKPTHKSYSASLPRVGEEAIVRLVRLSGVGNNKDRLLLCQTGKPRDLAVRCRAVRGTQYEFAVYYVRRDKSRVLGYFFVVDYAQNDIRRRTVVKGPDGRIAKRPGLIDGWPVPFHCFLSTAAEPANRQEQVNELEGHRAGWRSLRWTDGSWRATLEFFGKSGEIEYQEQQSWSSDEWLWSKCGASWHHGRTGWLAVRKTPPGPSSDQF